jgi:hypothetical protein
MSIRDRVNNRVQGCADARVVLCVSDRVHNRVLDRVFDRVWDRVHDRVDNRVVGRVIEEGQQ